VSFTRLVLLGKELTENNLQKIVLVKNCFSQELPNKNYPNKNYPTRITQQELPKQELPKQELPKQELPNNNFL